MYKGRLSNRYFCLFFVIDILRLLAPQGSLLCTSPYPAGQRHPFQLHSNHIQSNLHCLSHLDKKLHALLSTRTSLPMLFVISIRMKGCLALSAAEFIPRSPRYHLASCSPRKTHGGRVGQEQIATTDTLADHLQPSTEGR